MMHPEHAGLLADVLEHPDEDGPRLILADWLEENGEVERSEFIRLQIAGEDLSRQRTLFHWGDARGACGLPSKVMDGYHILIPPEFAFEVRLSSDGERKFRFVWRRGFVERINLPLAQFMEHAGAIFRQHPVREVKLTDRVPRAMLRIGAYWARSQSPDLEYYLPPALFSLLDPGLGSMGFASYATTEDALSALSSVCVRFGRQQAESRLWLPHTP